MQYNTHLLRHIRRIIGSNIHRLRTQQRLPMRTLARLTGISEHLLDHYELGKNDITLMALLKIACALEVEVSALMQ